jgi:putative two-component system response regulator
MTKNTTRILVVDDDEMLCQLLKRWLVKEGYECVSAYSGEEAMDRLDESRYALMITDINMPGITGMELLAMIRGKYQDMSTIVASAIDDRSIAINALELGAFTYIIKPLSKAETLIGVENALRHRQLERENLEFSEEMDLLVLEQTKGLRRKEKEIRLSRDETIRCLARAAEFRDDDTAQHTLRVGRYCQLLAEKAELDPEICRLIGAAGPLHDVGKIGIPDQILLKPGKLTSEEFGIIKTHCEIGRRILGDSTSDLLLLAAEIAYTHHEKIDGSGYPAGLKGEAIPIAGRITAICDVFDALTFDRVYKKAFTVEEAVGILQDGSGLHFDPALLNLFLMSLDEILEIRQRYSGGIQDPDSLLKDGTLRALSSTFSRTANE